MAYTVKARYYADPDQLGESYVITSDNADKDTKLEIGEKVRLVKPVEGITVIKIQNSASFNIENAFKVHGDAEYIKIIGVTGGGPNDEVELFRGRLWDKGAWRAKMKLQKQKFMEIIKEE
jgi:hypothetical protein